MCRSAPSSACCVLVSLILLYFFCSSWEEFPLSADTVFTSFYLHVTTSERLRGWDDSRRGHPAATTAQVSGPCVFSAEEQRGWLTLSRDADVILISLGSNSLNFPSPSSPPQLNITFPLKLPRSNRSHSSLFPSPLKLQRVMHFTASLQHFPNCTRWPDTHTHTHTRSIAGCQFEWSFLNVKVTNKLKCHLVGQVNTP